jgi:coenzyme F420-reducing hydrogenase gamma subunit
MVGLTACSGCQLTLLNCEEELPLLLERVRFDHFPLASDPPAEIPAVDVALVEGAVSTEQDLAILTALRRAGRLLVAVGTCAAWGGVACLRNDTPRGLLAAEVYGPHLTPPGLLVPSPLHRHVTVDFTVVGCPPEKHELLQTLAALARGTLPLLPRYPVCMECRERELPCLLQERQILCLGPLSRAGCGARCPAVSVGCEGCRGPAEESSRALGVAMLEAQGFSRTSYGGRLQRFLPTEEWPP